MTEHKPGHCCECGVDIRKIDWFYTVNPEGGYGRPEVLLCEPCMMTDEWADYRNRKGIEPVEIAA
jgi:hypothetical protein